MNNENMLLWKIQKGKKRDLISIFYMGVDKTVKFQNTALKFNMCVTIDTNLLMLPNVCA